jgi:hypothetical protein
MFRAAHRSSSGALTIFAASGLHTYVVTSRSQVPLRLDYGRSPHTYVNQRLQRQLELLMTSGVLLETCWAFNERLNNKFYYKVSSCWLFILSHTVEFSSIQITQAERQNVLRMQFCCNVTVSLSEWFLDDECHIPHDLYPRLHHREKETHKTICGVWRNSAIMILSSWFYQ